MALGDWLDVEFLQICARHVSGSIGAMVSFKVTAMVADYFIAHGWLKTVVHLVENFTLVVLLIWLVYQLSVLLWNRRVGDGQRTILIVA